MWDVDVIQRPTPKLVPGLIAHKNGFLERPPGSLPQILIEHPISRGQRVDWFATAKDLGRQLVDATEALEKSQGRVRDVERKLGIVEWQSNNKTTTIERYQEWEIELQRHPILKLFKLVRRGY